MNREHPMSAAEEAEFFAHLARVEGLRAERRRQRQLESPAEASALRGTCFDPGLPAFLRRQAE
jgi:hypothetical protein